MNEPKKIEKKLGLFVVYAISTGAMFNPAFSAAGNSKLIERPTVCRLDAE